jgi:hypothetical protein
MMFNKGKDQSREDSLAGRMAFNINTAGLAGTCMYIYIHMYEHNCIYVHMVYKHVYKYIEIYYAYGFFGR